MRKIDQNLKFNPKRNFNLTTPCCNKNNKDGKFTNYINLPEHYGYCHSCGQSNIPANIYADENGSEYHWNSITNRFEKLNGRYKNIMLKKCISSETVSKVEQKYIDEAIIWNYYHALPENNLMHYLRKKYCINNVNDAKETYAIGTSDDGGTIFWSINSNLKVQKAKIAYYNENGKRTNKFKVPYKNEDGYINCLFGEHLVYDKIKGKKTIVLVESEKTAIVGHILLPKYVWVAYGGINGLTEQKLHPLIGHNVLIIPDMSNNALSIAMNKIPSLLKLGINVRLWDLTDGKSDDELKSLGLYNNDLEDFFRNFI